MICFLSAPHNTSMYKVSNIIRDLGVDIINDLDIPIGDSIQTTIPDQISKADFVICLYSEKQAPWILFELGIATAMKKEILFLVKSRENLPSILSNHKILRYLDGDFEALRKNIEVFIFGMRNSKNGTEHVLPKSLTGKQYKNIHDQYVISNNNNLNYTKLTNAFKNVASSIEAEPATSKNTVADFAIWIDELDAFFGNPILIEHKVAIENKSQLDSITNKLKRQLKQTGLKTGLIVYERGDKSADIVITSDGKIIYYLDFETIISLLEKNDFIKYVMSYRNLLVHSVGKNAKIKRFNK